MKVFVGIFDFLGKVFVGFLVSGSRLPPWKKGKSMYDVHDHTEIICHFKNKGTYLFLIVNIGYIISEHCVIIPNQTFDYPVVLNTVKP